MIDLRVATHLIALSTYVCIWIADLVFLFACLLYLANVANQVHQDTLFIVYYFQSI